MIGFGTALGIVVGILLLCALAIAMETAPEGYEDEEGFHRIKKG